MINDIKTFRKEISFLIKGYFNLIRFKRKYEKSLKGYFPEISIYYMNNWTPKVIQASYHTRIDSDTCCLNLKRFCKINGFDNPKIEANNYGSDKVYTIEAEIEIGVEVVFYFRAHSPLNCKVEVKEKTTYEVVSSCLDVHNAN